MVSRDGAADSGDAPLDLGGDAPTDAGAGGSAADAPARPGLPIGQACGAPTECQSGFCFDGVCCASECSGPCRSCASQGSVGTCLPAPVGTDPRDDCDDTGATSCGDDGMCNGAGACRKYPAGIICKQPSCSGSTLTAAFRCDGAGACLPTSGQPCNPFLCGGDGRCATTCMTDGDCVAPNTCNAGSCGKKPPGGSCAGPDDCNSGFCAQGVCCQTDCTGFCMSCAVAGSAGTCIAVPSGQDPLGQCADQGAASCATDGTCDGKGGCRLYTAGTFCAAPTCAGSTEQLAGRCDGAGTCLAGAAQPCDPYTCGSNGFCLAACASDTDCSTGNVCTAMVCGKKILGAACSVASECASGFCEQNVCCQAACDGTCMSCALAGTAGQCRVVPSGLDPLGQCNDQGATSCGTDGACNGAGACRLYAPGTVCGTPSCGGSTLTLASRCDGLGNCATGSTQPCTPYVCGGPSACLTTCMTSADCTTGNVCTAASCGKKPLSASCATGSECASGICAQNVCCQTACSGTCMSCALAAAAGTCTPVPAGQDPLDQCADAGASTCNTNGLCDGVGGCQLYAAGTSCADATCSGSALASPRSCDGKGTCQAPTPSSCAPFNCSTTAPACLTSCTADTDCVSPNVCNSGVCGKKLLGAACTAGTDCASGLCQQQVCCSSACTGTCQSCALPGSPGTCTKVPVGQDPLGQCMDNGPAACGTDGFCDGNGGCRLYAAGTPCVAAACTGSTFTPARTCDGAGTCQPVTPSSCNPFLCDTTTNTSCRTTCSTSADCLAPNTCANNSCGNLANGAACTIGTQCTSGFCAQGVCCNTACAGVCQACNLTGNVGTCASVPAGQDPLGQCTDQGPTSCGTDGFCNGSGACRLYASGTVCRASTGACDLVETCNGTTASCPADTGSTPPGAPTGLAAVAGNGQVSLTWNAVPGATAYAVKRGTTSGGPYTVVASPAATSFVNTGLANGTTFFYVVAATSNNGACSSASSAQVSAMPSTCPNGVYCASFETDATGTFPAGWTRVGGSSGDWEVSANAADTVDSTHVLGQDQMLSSTARFAFASGGSPAAPWSGATSASADVKVLAWSGTSGGPAARVCLRYSDTSNFYCLALIPDNGGAVQIQTKVVGNTANSAAFATALAVGTWVHVKLSVTAAGAIQVFIGASNTLLGTFTPPSTLASGFVAFGTVSAEAAFDDLVVTQP